jgi:hypothetical protein
MTKASFAIPVRQGRAHTDADPGGLEDRPGRNLVGSNLAGTRDYWLASASRRQTAGPPLYEVYVVTPAIVFAFGTDETRAAHSTRWQF